MIFLRSVHAGANNSGKTGFPPYGLDFQKTQESNQEMEYTAGKNICQLAQTRPR
jgi:hypothetical protein